MTGDHLRESASTLDVHGYGARELIGHPSACQLLEISSTIDAGFDTRDGAGALA